MTVLFFLDTLTNKKITVYLTSTDYFSFRFCGHTTFGSIPSPSGTMQLELKTHDQPNGQPVAIGFSVEYNAE